MRQDEQTLKHSVIVAGLEVATTYFFKVYSFDANENISEAVSDKFTTLAGADEDPPLFLRRPAVTGLTDQFATLRWTSDEVSTSTVAYGQEADFSDATVNKIADPVLEHSVALSNLLPSTEYLYRINITDATGNISKPVEGRFKTLSAPDEDPPVFVEGPLAMAVTDNGARIEFSADEDVNVELECDATGADVAGILIQRADQKPQYSIPLTNLLADQAYLCALNIRDVVGNVTQREGIAFRTCLLYTSDAADE